MTSSDELRKRASDYRDEAVRLQDKAAQLENQANKQDTPGQSSGSANPII